MNAMQTDGKWDVERIRRDFAILNRPVRGDRELAYLDNAATTQKPAPVVCAICDYYQAFNANVHRSLHFLGEQATQRFEEARGKVARFLGSDSARNVVFTRGATESLNLVAYGWGRKFVHAGDEIVLTEMEHHSNLVPWQMLARATGATLRFVPVTANGELDLAAYCDLLSPRVKLVAATQISNVLGTVNPVREMIADAHKAGALFVLDAAQSVPHQLVNVQHLGCDFLVFSGHKMLGPTGIGVLYGRAECLEAMDPFMTGGDMISRVELERATWADVPQKFEAGTPNISGAIGLGAAMDYLEALGRERAAEWELRLTRLTLARLEELPGVRILGRAHERIGVISFDVAGVHPHDLAQYLDQEGLAVRAGHLCAQPLLRKFGLHAVTRASLYLYNRIEEVERLASAVARAREFFSHGPR